LFALYIYSAMATINLPNYTATIGTLTVNNSLTSGSISTGMGSRLGISAGVGSGSGSVAIGTSAGNSGMLSNAYAIGASAGRVNATTNSISIGTQANEFGTTSGLSIGTQAGQNGSGNAAIAIGHFAGKGTSAGSVGEYSVCIGCKAGATSCAANAVAISGMNAELNPATAGLFCNALVGRIGTGKTPNSLWYNQTTNEIYYIIT
jgi:hypothetical protein